MLVNFTVRIWSPSTKVTHTDLHRTVELPYVPTIGMTFEGNTVKYVNGSFEKPNDILVVFDTISMNREDSLEDYNYLLESYIKEGWVKNETGTR